MVVYRGIFPLGFSASDYFSNVADKKIGCIPDVALLNMGHYRNVLELGNDGLESGSLLRACQG